MKCPKCKVENPEDSHFCKKCGAALKEISATLTSPPPEKEEKDEKSSLDFAPGQYFGKRYQIIEEIGRGGMGRVYKALDKELNRTVALKMIKPEISSHPGIVERFKKEIKLASQITHENVCRIHDLGEVEGIKYISMKFIEGNNLLELIQSSRRLSVETSIHITEQICHALNAAHKKGVIHRDLKPQNIMIDKKGNAYVMDFGIARSLEAEEVTKPGAIIGTPHYMSPEQAEGKAADARSDIYSLGCILYEMLTGKPPFEADTSAALIHKHIKENPRPPSKINPQISLDLEKVILKCMEKEPDKRYQGADEIAKAITETKPEPISATKPAKFRWKLVVPITAIILIGIAIGFYHLLRKEKPSTPSIPTEWKNSIAVLPFEDLSPQKDQEYFCDGLAEVLINSLTKIKDLRVVARTSAFSFKGQETDIQEIGKKLNVEAVLEGSIQKADNRLRITIQLINVTDGYHLWSEKFDRDLKDIFAIQDEISLAIINALKIKLEVDEKTLIAKRYTDDLEAYNLYLKGRYFWNKRTEEELKKAIEYFQQAIEKDPTYALAYSGIADCYNMFGVYRYFPPKEVNPKARAAAENALEIDDTSAEAHNSLAWIKMTHYRDWSAAEIEFRRAIELNPGYAPAHHWYALYLLWGTARFDESIVEIKRAQELDPLSVVINRDVGYVFYIACKYDQAIEAFQKALEMDSSFPYSHLFLGWVYLKKSMYKEALTEFHKENNLSKGGNPFAEAWIGVAYALMGKRGEAYQLLSDLLERSKHEYVVPSGVARVYFILRENDQGFKWIEKAYEQRDFWLTFLIVDPLFDPIRSDPRFKTLLKKMNLE